MTDARCEFTLDNDKPCNSPLPCKHHPTVTFVRDLIRDLQSQLDEGTHSR